MFTTVDSKGYGIATPKGSRWKDKISQAILYLQEKSSIQVSSSSLQLYPLTRIDYFSFGVCDIIIWSPPLGFTGTTLSLSVSDDLQQMVEAWDQKVSEIRWRQVQGLFTKRCQHWWRLCSPVLWPRLRHPSFHRGVLFQTPRRLGTPSLQIQERKLGETREWVISVAADHVLVVTHV